MSDAKFKIEGILYDFPTHIRLGDAVLVRELTGIDVEELADAPPLVSITAYLAIAVWQANPKWQRSKVVRFIEAIDVTQFEVEGGEDDGPPVEGVATLSPPTSGASISEPADLSARALA